MYALDVDSLGGGDECTDGKGGDGGVVCRDEATADSAGKDGAPHEETALRAIAHEIRNRDHGANGARYMQGRATAKITNEKPPALYRRSSLGQ